MWKKIVGLLAVVVLLGVVGYLSWDTGHSEGYDEGYGRGYSAGQEQGYSQGYETGQEDGYEQCLESGIIKRNPTYEEMKEFLTQDKTNWNRWIAGEYVCVDFAADLDNNAEAEGIRAGYVFLVFSYPNGGKEGHLVVCFETVDRSNHHLVAT